MIGNLVPGLLAYFCRSVQILIVLGLIISTPLLSQHSKISIKPNLVASRIEAPLHHDGIVNELLWQKLEVATNFTQQNPDEGKPASQKTEVRVGFDDINLYFGVICFDSEPHKIVVNENYRDSNLSQSDSIQILLDTFNDGQNGFIFGTNPSGVQFDSQVSKSGLHRGGGGPRRAGQGGAQRGGSASFNINWDGVWKVRSQITKRGWESEIVIPFRTLRYHAGETTWGFNISRRLPRRKESSFWAPISRAFQFREVSTVGSLSALETKTHRSLKIIPYLLSGFSQDYFRQEDQLRFERNLGVDLKYSITPNLTLDTTVNTDFAQVEIDDNQVDLTRFNLFFPEKRMFFLENSGFFEFGSPREVEIFFSRRIGLDEDGNPVPIDVGARLTGKIGPYQIGLLNMQTRSIGSGVAANNYSVLRLSRELPNRSSIGVIGVNREMTTDTEGVLPYNRTAGLDANFGLGKFANWFSYMATSKTPGLKDNNHTYSSRFQYDNSRHEFSLGYLEVGTNFNPEVGFLKRSGFRKPHYFYRFTYHPSSTRILSIEPHFSGKNWLTLETNDRESSFEHYHVQTIWKNGGRLGLAWNRNFERLDDSFEVHSDIFIPVGKYHFSELIADFSTDPSATQFFNGNAAVGSFYNGKISSFNLRGGYRIGKSLSWTGSWIGNFIKLPVGEFGAHLIGLQFKWSITPKNLLQSFSQYNSVTREIGHNIRLGILSKSSNGLYVVFNTLRNNLGFRDPHEVYRNTVSQSLFLKYTHLFEF